MLCIVLKKLLYKPEAENCNHHFQDFQELKGLCVFVEIWILMKYFSLLELLLNLLQIFLPSISFLCKLSEIKKNLKYIINTMFNV